MTQDDLRKLADGLPDGGSAVLPKKALHSLLDHLNGAGPVKPPAERDLTLREVAERVGRAVSTVKGWCNRGEVPGAYKLNGRDWRVPPAALEAYLRHQREGKGRGQLTPRGNYDLSSWRKEL